MLFVTAGHCHTISWKYKDSFLSIAPLFHIGGLAPMLTNVHCGTAVVFLPDFDPVKVWDLIAQERITFMMTVPVMLVAMLRVPGIGVKSAALIIASRRFGRLGAFQLKKMGIVMKKAQYFITCNELPARTINELKPEMVKAILVAKPKKRHDDNQLEIPFKEETIV